MTLKKLFLIATVAHIGVVLGDGGTAGDVDWPSVGGDWGNTRYSALKQVNTQTIKRLGARWTRKFNASGTTSAVVVADRRMFVTGGADVYAIDPVTGQIVWSYKPVARPSQKGVAVGGGRVYVGLANAEMIALDEKKGTLLWSVHIGDEGWRGVTLGRPVASTLPKPAALFDTAAGQYIAAAPAYVDETVIVGLSNGDYGLRGRIAGVDAANGKRLWQFFTVPAPGKFGHDTWPRGLDVWKTGGGGVWMNPAVDPLLRMVYVGVGNPVPQWGGEIRPGDNLFTDSVVALDIKTGKLIWYFQGVHHDIWDHDFGTPLVLFDMELGGRKRRGIAAMRTDGYLFELDRESGRPLLPIVERPVPYDDRMKMSRTQPFPRDADEIGPRCVEKDMVPAGFQRKCYFDPLGLKPNLVFPFRTVRAAPLSFSPQTGYFYVAGGVEPTWHQRTDDPYYYGGLFQPTAGFKNYGLLTALDARTGKIAWQKRLPHSALSGSGATSTAGGLVFHGEPDGRLQAYDAMSGELLWSFQTGAPADGPVSVYEVRGEEIIVVGARDLWTFKLGGTIPPRDAPRAPPSETQFSGPAIRSNTIEIAAPRFDAGVTGQHGMFDEYAFRPLRTRVPQGGTLTWVNKGKLTHTIYAQDGSWTTGPIGPGQSRSLAMAKPGRYLFRCSEYPWSTGEIIVGEAGISPQVRRGESLYQENCAVCHGNDLGGQEPAPQLAGLGFRAKWEGRAIGDLYELIRTTMPPNRPGILSDQQYIDLVTFLLDSNDIPSSSEELTPSSKELATRQIGSPPLN